MEASPFAREPRGLCVALKVTPKAAREGVLGVVPDAAGAAWLAIKVSAPAEGGRANEAVLRLLARRWRLPASALSIIRGAAGRRKRLLVAGDAEALLARLRAIERG